MSQPSPDLFDEIRDKVAIYPLDDHGSLTWRSAVRCALRLVLGWDLVRIQYDPWEAIHLEPSGRTVRIGAGSVSESLTRTGSDDPDSFLGHGTSLQDAAVRIVKKILAYHLLGCSASATTGDASTEVGDGIYLHLEDQPPEPSQCLNLSVPDYFLNLLDPGNLSYRIGGAFIPPDAGFCMLWGSHFSIQEQPSLGVEMNATMATLSPSGVVLFPYVESKPDLEIGDQCPSCGGIWTERALFNSTFVGCLC